MVNRQTTTFASSNFNGKRPIGSMAEIVGHAKYYTKGEEIIPRKRIWTLKRECLAIMTLHRNNLLAIIPHMLEIVRPLGGYGNLCITLSP